MIDLVIRLNGGNVKSDGMRLAIGEGSRLRGKGSPRFSFSQRALSMPVLPSHSVRILELCKGLRETGTDFLSRPLTIQKPSSSRGVKGVTIFHSALSPPRGGPHVKVETSCVERLSVLDMVLGHSLHSIKTELTHSLGILGWLSVVHETSQP